MIPRIFLFLWLYCASIGGVFAFLNAAERMSGGLLGSLFVHLIAQSLMMILYHRLYEVRQNS